MNVLVYGAGAVGSFVGAVLARAGERVSLLGRPAHVQAVARGGLHVEGPGGSRTWVRIAAASRPEEL
ncbi:MAG: 2-dehydropantoate 2-reductase N-terminal domain-containing protein, partial [Armatimonadota bacterium]|nr:2-dehydropantoate 2-reductase N-terminal domain-containing protein [Armatimonadota bacterium]